MLVAGIRLSTAALDANVCMWAPTVAPDVDFVEAASKDNKLQAEVRNSDNNHPGNRFANQRLESFCSAWKF
jgi:hypothetical protein